MGELLIAERQDLQDIADKLKAKVGRTDKINFPNGFMDIVDELGQGGNASGIENGCNVVFYDEFDEKLSLVSVRKGLSVDAPYYSCKAWQTEDGENQFFPFTPTGDIAFYANNDTLEKILYEYYGVDKAAYPHLLITYRDNIWGNYGLYIVFGNYISNTDIKTVRGIGTNKNMSRAEIGDFSPEHIVNLAMQKLTTLQGDFSASVGYNSNHYNYANFDVTYGNPYSYRLDE